MRDSTTPSTRRPQEDSLDTSLLDISPRNSTDNPPKTFSDGHDRVGLNLQENTEGMHGRREERESSHSSRSLSSDLELGDMRESYRLDDEEDTRLTGVTKGEGNQESGQHGGLEGRSSIESVDMWQEAQRIGKQAFIRKILINGTLIALWYVFSISISVYNKWMFSPGNLDFHFPMFTTSLHMLVQFSLASLVLLCFPHLRPRQGIVDNAHSSAVKSGRAEDEAADAKKPIMTPWFYLTRIVTCGTATGLDIGLGNTSLKYITLTFFTMCKSSTLGFVLCFAIFFRLEKPSWTIGGIIGLMTVGVVMMVTGETEFNFLGFALLMMASFCSGIRWSLTQMLLRRTPATSNPFSSLFFLTPVMFVVLFLVAIPAEGFSELKAGLDNLIENKGLFMGLGILLFPGCLAFFMTSAEFALLKRSSVVTLSVCGIFKEVLTITAAGLIFGDVLTPINISGLLVTLAAIAFYNFVRMRKMKRQEMAKAVESVEEAAEAAAPGSTAPHGKSPAGANADEATQSLLAGDVQKPGIGGSTVRRSLNMQHDFEQGPAPLGGPPRAAFMKRVQDED